MTLKARIATPFRLSWPVLRRLFVDAVLLVPAHAIVAAAVLWAAAQLMASRWADAGGLAALGGWSLTASYALLGGVGGAIAGAIAACARTLAHIERHTEAWILALPTDWGRDLLPEVPLDELEGRYDETLDRVTDATLGRLPVPRLVRRMAKSRLRQALLDDFLATCRERGVTVVGHGELRNWLLTRGLAYALEPARAQLRVWRAVTLGGLGLAALIAVAIAVLGGMASPVTVVLIAFALTGAGILVWGLPRARERERPAQWRVGIVTLALSATGWPALYVLLWPADLGLVWLVVVALTLVTVRWGFERAFVRGGPARLPA